MTLIRESSAPSVSRARRSRPLGPLVAFLVALACAMAEARAEDEAPLTVTRTGDAQDCLDAAALEKAVVRVRGRPVPKDVAVRFDVAFSRSGRGFVAELRARGERGVRHIEDASPRCDGLSQALVVALVILLDTVERGEPVVLPGTSPEPPVPVPGATSPVPGAPSPVPGATSPVPGGPPPRSGRVSLRSAPPSPRPEPESAPFSPSFRAEAGLLAAVGVVPGVGFGYVGGLDVRFSSHLLAGAGVRWLAPSDASVPPGTVSFDLFAATARLCGAPSATDEPLVWTLCATALAGSLGAKATGFPLVRATSRPHLAAGPGLSATYPLVGGLRVGVTAEALFPLGNETFSIDGLGPVHEPSALSGLFAGTLGATIW